MGKIILAVFIMTSLFLSLLQAQERSAVIICARSGNQSLFDENKKYTIQTIEILKKAGITAVQCFIEGGEESIPSAKKANAQEILDSLKKLSASLKQNDELWLFIYGYANLSGKKLSIATEGGRMNGAELAASVNSIAAKKYIFCLNIQSYPLMELLKDKNSFILSASSDSSQTNPPLLPSFLLEKWLNSPEKPFNEVLCDAAKDLGDYFRKNSMAIAETPVLAVGDELCKYPFDVYVKPLKPAGVVFAAKKTEETTPEKVPSDIMQANEESTRIISEAKLLLPEYSTQHAFYSDLEMEYTVNTDNTAKCRERGIIYLCDDAGAGHYKRFSFSETPPYSEFQLLMARIIYPDGKYLDIKTEKFPNKNGGSLYTLDFPGILPGCAIVLQTEFRYRNESNMPFFQTGITVQKQIPLDKYFLKIQSPLKRENFIRTVNGKAETKVSENIYSKITELKFRKVPAFEPLPYDPPQDEVLTKVLLSHTETWDQFGKWAASMFEGTDKLDAETAGFVKDICSKASDDTAKLRVVYEFLCNLRYDTTPAGARAFRPRLPAEVFKERYGDCKDKANALVSMAAVAGIKGYVALVKRGGRVISDFPSNQFNHAVAYFPELKGFPDGLWCDPTDTSTVFGSLPPGDIGCDAFIMNGKNPEFKKVQNHHKQKNILSQEIVFDVTADEKFTGKVVYRAEGLQDYFMRMKFRNFSALQQKNILQEMLNKCFTGAYVETFALSAGTDLSEPFTVTGEFSGDYWPMLRGSIQPPFDLWGPFSMKDRKRQLFLNDGQPLKVVQTVKVNGAALKGEGNWQESAGTLQLKCSYEKTARTVEIDLTDGFMQEEDYRKCLPLVRKFYSKITQ